MDIIFIGLFDLSKALGKPGQTNDPEVIGHLSDLTKKIRASGKFVGTIATSKEQMKSFIEMGVRYITYSVDCDMFRKAYADIL